jgi:hypothetical protein
MKKYKVFKAKEYPGNSPCIPWLFFVTQKMHERNKEASEKDKKSYQKRCQHPLISRAPLPFWIRKQRKLVGKNTKIILTFTT